MVDVKLESVDTNGRRRRHAKIAANFNKSGACNYPADRFNSPSNLCTPVGCSTPENKPAKNGCSSPRKDDSKSPFYHTPCFSTSPKPGNNFPSSSKRRPFNKCSPIDTKNADSSYISSASSSPKKYYANNNTSEMFFNKYGPVDFASVGLNTDGTGSVAFKTMSKKGYNGFKKQSMRSDDSAIVSSSTSSGLSSSSSPEIGVIKNVNASRQKNFKKGKNGKHTRTVPTSDTHFAESAFTTMSPPPHTLPLPPADWLISQPSHLFNPCSIQDIDLNSTLQLKMLLKIEA